MVLRRVLISSTVFPVSSAMEISARPIFFAARRKLLTDDPFLHIDDIFYFFNEPFVDLGDVMNLLDAADPPAQCFRNDKKPLIIDPGKIFLHPSVIPAIHRLQVQPMNANFQRTNSF